DFLSFDPDFQQTVQDVLVVRGAEVHGSLVQLIEAGPGRGMFNFFGVGTEDDLDGWEYRAADGVVMPDMESVSFHYFECRWEAQVAEIAREVAAASPGPVWLVDSDCVVWDAANVD